MITTDDNWEYGVNGGKYDEVPGVLWGSLYRMLLYTVD